MQASVGAVLAVACAITAARSFMCARQTHALERNTLDQPYERAAAWLRRHACPSVLRVVRRGSSQTLTLRAGEVCLVADEADIVHDVLVAPPDGGEREVVHGGVVKVFMRPCSD